MVAVTRQVLRPAQPGDICVLLAPADPEEEGRLRLCQQALQTQLGGRPASPVHLTCQRFQIADPSGLSGFVDRLAAWMTGLPPLEFAATGMEVLHLDDKFNALKWRVDLSPEYCHFLERLHDEVQAVGGRSTYPLGWASRLVTALYRIDTERLHLVGDSGFPYPLFTAKTVVISQYLKRLSYKTLETFQFAD